MSSASRLSPAGRPSTITTRARPCDSPAVRKRNIATKRTGGPLPARRRFRSDDERDVDGGEREGRSERERSPTTLDDSNREPEHDADDARQEQRDHHGVHGV